MTQMCLCHHLLACTTDLPATVKVTIEACAGGYTVIDVNAVVQQHASIIPNLLAVHALIGCDTTSSIAGVGMAMAFKRLEGFNEPLQIGEADILADAVYTSCERYVCALYGQMPSTSLQVMREQMFSRKIASKKHIPPKFSTLSPTSPAFRLHCKWAHYQTALWKAAVNAAPPELDPQHFGWTLAGSVLEAI